MKLKVCECYDRWNESAPDCEWAFRPKHGNERYCDACKPLAERLRIRKAVYKYRGIDLDALLESTDREWLASWIDARCTKCGNKGVPTFNKFLCYTCWSQPEEITHEIAPKTKVRLIHREEPEPNGEVIIYSSKDYTQEQLQDILQQ